MGVDKDHAKERANEVDGKIKEVTRKIVDDKKLETKGNPRRCSSQGSRQARPEGLSRVRLCGTRAHPRAVSRRPRVDVFGWRDDLS